MSYSFSSLSVAQRIGSDRVAWLGGFFGRYSWSLVGLATLWFAKLRCSKMGLLAETEHVALQLRRFGHHR